MLVTIYSRKSANSGRSLVYSNLEVDVLARV